MNNFPVTARVETPGDAALVRVSGVTTYAPTTQVRGSNVAPEASPAELEAIGQARLLAQMSAETDPAGNLRVATLAASIVYVIGTTAYLYYRTPDGEKVAVLTDFGLNLASGVLVSSVADMTAGKLIGGGGGPAFTVGLVVGLSSDNPQALESERWRELARAMFSEIAQDDQAVDRKAKELKVAAEAHPVIDLGKNGPRSVKIEGAKGIVFPEHSRALSQAAEKAAADLKAPPFPQVLKPGTFRPAAANKHIDRDPSAVAAQRAQEAAAQASRSTASALMQTMRSIFGTLQFLRPPVAPRSGPIHRNVSHPTASTPPSVPSNPNVFIPPASGSSLRRRLLLVSSVPR